VSNAIDEGIEPSPEYVLNEYYGINQEQGETGRKGLFEHFEDYIKAKSSRVGRHTVNDYHALKKHLKGYERWNRSKLEFNSINYSFYQKFMKYLSHDAVKPDGEKGLAVNTIGKTLKNLKIFLRDCARKNIIEPIDTSDFKVYQEDVENIYLIEKEINAIYKLDLSNEKDRERIRDLFVLGCFTGLRFSDLSSIKPANIKGDFIHLRQGKP
jgi:integrase